MRTRAWIACLLLGGALGCSPAATSQPPAARTAPAAPSQVRPLGAASVSPIASALASPALARSGAAAPVAQSAANPEQDWLTYQHDLTRSGRASGTYTAASARPLWDSNTLDGEVYAQVLATADRVFVATENNTVYALDASSGATIWSQHFGDPVPRSRLPCGNIDPTGITSTPVIDPASGLLYAVDFVQADGGLRHDLVALDVATGAVRFDVPIDPPGSTPAAQQQRAALAVNNGTVYVPFGGLFGDCGPYHGWVVAASANDGTLTAAYQVASQREAAIWASAAFNAGGDLYVATGNGASTSEFDQSNAVLHLSPDLQLLDFFAPQNWADLNRRDADLGSTGPVLLDNNLVFQIGKTGDGYLLQADNLGQVGGQLATTSVCSGAYGGSAHTGDMIYVACRNGLAAVQVQGQSLAVLWHGPQFNAGAPTLAGDAIWTVDDGTATLYALNPADGSVVFRAPPGQVANLPHFLSASAAGGRLFHSRGTFISAYLAS